jgi:hypothetical protein
MNSEDEIEVDDKGPLPLTKFTDKPSMPVIKVE